MQVVGRGGRVDWLFLGGWVFLAFYVVGFWVITGTAYTLLSHAL
jgi:hypothetical protein